MHDDTPTTASKKPRKKNAWNEFQSANKHLGLSQTQLKDAYQAQKNGQPFQLPNDPRSAKQQTGLSSDTRTQPLERKTSKGKQWLQQFEQAVTGKKAAGSRKQTPPAAPAKSTAPLNAAEPASSSYASANTVLQRGSGSSALSWGASSSKAYSTGTAPLHSPEDFPQQPTQITQQQNSRGSETAKKKKSKFKALIGKFRRVLGVSKTNDQSPAAAAAHTAVHDRQKHANAAPEASSADVQVLPPPQHHQQQQVHLQPHPHLGTPTTPILKRPPLSSSQDDQNEATSPFRPLSKHNPRPAPHPLALDFDEPPSSTRQGTHKHNAQPTLQQQQQQNKQQQQQQQQQQQVKQQPQSVFEGSEAQRRYTHLRDQGVQGVPEHQAQASAAAAAIGSAGVSRRPIVAAVTVIEPSSSQHTLPEPRSLKDPQKRAQFWVTCTEPDPRVTALPDFTPYTNTGGLRVRARENVPDNHDRYFQGFTAWMKVPATKAGISSVRREIPREKGLYEWGAKAVGQGNHKVWAIYLGQAGDLGSRDSNDQTLRSRFYKYSNANDLPFLGPFSETCVLKACIFRELQRKGFSLYYRWCVHHQPECRETEILSEIDYAANSKKNNERQRQPIVGAGGVRLADLPIVLKHVDS